MNGTGYDLNTTSHTETLAGINTSGAVIGSTNRFTGFTSLGTDAWVYQADGSTKILSLTGGAYNSTAAANFHSSLPSKINVLGEVAGFANRYNGAGVGGQDAWIYDPAANGGAGTTFVIQLSVNPVDNITAFSSVSYLSDTGVALGLYRKYNSSGGFVQEAFSWQDSTDANGVTTATATDLNIQVPNAATENWANLFNALNMDAVGNIYGYGLRTTNAAGNSPAAASQEIFAARAYHIGDATDDGHVDLNDLNTVLNNLGTTTSLWTNGNFDGAATIDLNDLNDVLNNLGTGVPINATVLAAEALVAGGTPAPEPASLALMSVASVLLIRRKRNA